MIYHISKAKNEHCGAEKYCRIERSMVLYKEDGVEIVVRAKTVTYHQEIPIIIDSMNHIIQPSFGMLLHLWFLCFFTCQSL